MMAEMLDHVVEEVADVEEHHGVSLGQLQIDHVVVVRVRHAEDLQQELQIHLRELYLL